MPKKLTVLVVPMEGMGHVNATLGVSQALKDRGHRVVYVITKPYEGQLVKYGFEEEVIENKEQENKKPGEQGGSRLIQIGIISGRSPIEKMKVMCGVSGFDRMLEQRMFEDKQIKEFVEKVNPDVIIMDDYIGLPSVVHSGRPWVFLGSATPLLYIGGDDLPPSGSGLY